MATVRELHEKAMRYAQEAMISRDANLARELARQAYDLEIRALELVPQEDSSEPTLSILRRSVASLAYQCGDYQAAENYVLRGLEGNPPSDIRAELEGLLKLIVIVKGDSFDQVLI